MRQKGSLAITAALLCIALSACAAGAESTPIETPTESREVVGLPARIRAEGLVVPREEIALSFSVSGMLAELSVEEGDTVQAGDILARLDTTLLDADVAVAEAQLVQAQAELARVLAGATPEEIAEAEYRVESAGATLSTAIPAQAAAREAERAAAQARLDYLRSLPRPEDVAIAQASVDQAQSVYQAALARRDQAQLVAPINGAILGVKASQYEYVWAGTTVLTMADLSQLRVRTEQIPEVDIARIKPGDTAELTFGALPGVTIQGVIERITPNVAEGRTSTFTVLITLPEIPEGLVWGMSVFINIEGG